jgi:hypothetical protein
MDMQWFAALTPSDKIAVISSAAAILQFVILFVTILVLRQNMKITERAYVSGGGYFPAEDESTYLKGEMFQLMVNNYGKTPAYVSRAEIGYLCSTCGFLPDPPPKGKHYDIGNTIAPGEKGLETDIKLSRQDMTGDIIFGRFFYEDIFAKRWWSRRPKVRSSGFILKIMPDRLVLPVNNPPRAYTNWD